VAREAEFLKGRGAGIVSKKKKFYQCVPGGKRGKGKTNQGIPHENRSEGKKSLTPQTSISFWAKSAQAIW